MNFTPEQSIVGRFEPVKGNAGYFLADAMEAIAPNSTTHYGKRLYMLINEESCSTATIFPATIRLP